MANDDIRTQLSERRNSLATAMERMGRSDHLTHLLREVDDALGKLNKGTYGICETCGDAIEGERLAIDPLIRNCLDHLTPMEQRILEHDLDLAHQVQSAFLPKRGARLGPWSVAYHYEAAGPVSGDYLDIVPLQHDPGSFLFLMGDVTGKGVAASILMSQLHAIFRSLSRSMLPLGELLKQANRLFWRPHDRLESPAFRAVLRRRVRFHDVPDVSWRQARPLHRRLDRGAQFER